MSAPRNELDRVQCRGSGRSQRVTIGRYDRSLVRDARSGGAQGLVVGRVVDVERRRSNGPFDPGTTAAWDQVGARAPQRYAQPGRGDRGGRPGGLYAPSPASTGCPTSPCGTSSPATRRYCGAGVRCEPIHLAAGLFVTVRRRATRQNQVCPSEPSETGMSAFWSAPG